MERGFLVFNTDTEKFNVAIKALSCGCPVEVLIKDKWIVGTIEGRNVNKNGCLVNEYYLLGEDKKTYSLQNNTVVRFKNE